MNIFTRHSINDSRRFCRLLLFTLFLACTGNACFSQNSALSFNGTSDHVTTSAFPVPVSGDFTVELWVNATAGGLRQFVSQGQAGSAFFIGMNSGSNIWLGDSWATTGVAMPLNEWTHLAVVKSGSNGTLYVNGIQAATTNSYSVGAGGTAFRIGKQYGGITEYTQGSIDEVRIWNTARSATQVKDGMYGSIPTNTTGLAAYYRFNEGSGTTVANASNSTVATPSSDGTLVSGSWLANSPVRFAENALQFDGTDDFFKTGTSTDYESASSTVECWVRTEQLVGNACILGYRSATTRYSFHMNATTIGMWNGSSYSTISHTFSPGQWYHLAFVMTSASTQIFVNGVSIGNTANVRSNVTGVEFFVGVAMSNTLSIMEPFKGAIDDIRVWNIAKTGPQIQSAMLGNLTGTETNLVRYWSMNQGIRGGSNTGLKKVIDLTSRNGHGQINNMTLQGNTSNWISHSTATLNPPPEVSSFTPSAAIPGGSVTISGNNFNTTAANNIVYFGSTRAAVTAATTTSLTVTSPGGGVYKPLSVTNSANGLTGYSSSPFIPTFNNGGGSIIFSAPVNLTAGDTPQGLDIADIDGDGKSDLVMANNVSGTVSVFRNIHSSGVITASSFAARADFTALASPSALAIADIDGDGKLDIVAVNSGSGQLSIFRNSSTSGSLSMASREDLSFTGNGRSVALADINADGRPELIVGTNNTLYLYENTSTSGTISFASSGTPVTLGTGGEFMIAAGDIDGDGKTDLIGTDFTGAAANLFIMRNNYAAGAISAASFETRVDFPVSMTVNTFGTPATGDLDGDGKIDIAVASPTENNVWLFRNVSSSGSISSSSLASAVTLASGNNPSSVRLADLNGDGKVDIFTSNTLANNVSTFSNIATAGTLTTASFSPKKDYPTADGGISLTAADLNNDGKAEIVVTASLTSLSVLPNTSSNVLLPLRFLFLHGKADGKDVLLDWKTADEFNTAKFDIEQSTDGRQFRAVGTVKSMNTGGEHLYTFTDVNAMGPSSSVLYYRIKQVDQNGQFTYSQTIRLQKQTSGNTVLLYPNPVGDRINLSVNIPAGQSVRVRIFDNSGTLIRVASFNLAAGTSSFYIDAAGLAKGVYYLEMQSEGLNKKIQFLK